MPASTTKAPLMMPYRTVDVADTLPCEDEKQGLNCSDHETLHVNVVPDPDGAANPDVEVLYWSDAAGAFIPNAEPDEFEGVGAAKPYCFSVPVKGRIVFIAVTDLGGAGSVTIETSAHGLQATMG